jgi:hypothetical protein
MARIRDRQMVRPAGAMSGSETKTSAVDAFGVRAAYQSAGRLLELAHGGGDGPTLIEIGPAERSLEENVAGAEVTRFDLDAATEALREGTAAGGAGSWPFQPGFFDYAVAVDALDRLDAELRPVFLAELRRVSSRGVLLAGPFDSPLVRAVERLVADALRVRGGDDRPAAARSLPTLGETRRMFEAHGDETTVYGDGSLLTWAAINCLAAAGSEVAGDLRELGGGWRAMPASEADLASYRSALICLREPSELGAEVAGFDPAATSAADRGALAAIVAASTLGGELRELHARLDERDQRLADARVALARRDAQVADLSHRLADSLAALEIARGEREPTQREIAAMQRKRAWLLMARAYTTSRRVRDAIRAPARMVRDSLRRVRRRFRAL